MTLRKPSSVPIATGVSSPPRIIVGRPFPTEGGGPLPTEGAGPFPTDAVGAPPAEDVGAIPVRLGYNAPSTCARPFEQPEERR